MHTCDPPTRPINDLAVIFVISVVQPSANSSIRCQAPDTLPSIHNTCVHLTQLSVCGLWVRLVGVIYLDIWIDSIRTKSRISWISLYRGDRNYPAYAFKVNHSVYEVPQCSSPTVPCCNVLYGVQSGRIGGGAGVSGVPRVSSARGPMLDPPPPELAPPPCHIGLHTAGAFGTRGAPPPPPPPPPTVW